MNLDLKKFKKISSDNTHTTFRHGGHEVRLEHATLKPKERGEIAAMPIHAAAGTLIEESPEAPPKEEVQAPNPNLPPNFDQRVQNEEERLAVNAGAPGATLGPKVPGMPEIPKDVADKYKDRAETNVASQHIQDEQRMSDQAQLAYEKQKDDIDAQNAIRRKTGLPLLNEPQAPPGMDQGPSNMESNVGIQRAQFSPDQNQQQQPAFNPDDFGYGQELSTYKKGAGQYQQGLEQQAQGEAQQGRDRAQALTANIDADRELQADFQNHVQGINKERDALIQDLQDQHINPNQFWENKSLPGKITSAIGLILGGMGSGGGQNQALQFMQKQIDNDIMAQRLNIGNKQSLLNANREKFQDEKSAVDMTRVMKNDMVAHQLDLAAANASDQNAKARLNQAAGQFKMQSASIVQQMAMRGAMMKGMNQPGVQQDPARKIQYQAMMGLIKPEQQQAALKELGTYNNMNKQAQNAIKSWQLVNQMNTPSNRLMNPVQSTSLIKTFESDLGMLAKESEGRVTESDVGYLKTLQPNMTDNPLTRQIKNQKFVNFVSSKMNFPNLDAIGIKYKAPRAIQMNPPVIVNNKGQSPVKQKAGSGF